MTDKVAITLEFTPNPNTLKFVVNKQLIEKGAANFTDSSKAENSPLAESLFKVPGISGILIGSNFITVTKSPTGDWDIVAEEVPKSIEAHLVAGRPVFAPGFDPSKSVSSSGASEVENKIREVLDNEIRPAVAMDGGDIVFGKYEEGVVYLQLQGACSSCPSSIATLKMGVETRLKEVIPEIKEVVQI